MACQTIQQTSTENSIFKQQFLSTSSETNSSLSDTCTPKLDHLCRIFANEELILLRFYCEKRPKNLSDPNLTSLKGKREVKRKNKIK